MVLRQLAAAPRRERGESAARTEPAQVATARLDLTCGGGATSPRLPSGRAPRRRDVATTPGGRSRPRRDSRRRIPPRRSQAARAVPRCALLGCNKVVVEEVLVVAAPLDRAAASEHVAAVARGGREERAGRGPAYSPKLDRSEGLDRDDRDGESRSDACVAVADAARAATRPRGRSTRHPRPRDPAPRTIDAAPRVRDPPPPMIQLHVVTPPRNIHVAAAASPRPVHGASASRSVSRHGSSSRGRARRGLAAASLFSRRRAPRMRPQGRETVDFCCTRG